MPEDMPDRMPEDMPDKMPEGMSDRMPEDLPVSKRINVMVGITRRKVFFACKRAGQVPAHGAPDKGAWTNLDAWGRPTAFHTSSHRLVQVV